MAVEIVMPKLSDTMEEGKILRWLKKEGDYVTKGEVIAEIETDKADMDLEVFSSGILSKILFKDGDTVPVGTVIAYLGEEEAETAQEEPKTTPKKPPVVVVGSTSGDPCCTVPIDEEGEEKKDEVKDDKVIEEKKGEKPKISPAAKRIVVEEGIDVTILEGTGPGGRVIKEDVEKYLKERAGKKETLRVVSQKEKGEEISKEEVVELSKMRATIGKRMTMSKQTIPHFYVTREVDMEEAVKMLESLNRIEGEETKITYNDLVIKACALALKDYPEINAHFVEKGLVQKKDINIGVVIGLKVGLLVPVVKDAQSLTLREISLQVKGLKERIFKKESTPEDLSGGSFTISNMGMFGVEEFSAIINPPQVAIMAVAAIKDTPVIKEGNIQMGKIMNITLSADHRALDGVIVARFLGRVKELIENPIY
jgi:pyruvate dehydrogenase E2 component (dihydrolipoamide acetyltransferase)